MKWNLEKRNVTDLVANIKNPRKLSKNDAEQLKRSMEKFGVCEPIVINCDGSIIGGHQRVKTLKAMKETEVDVYVPSEALSELEASELNIRLNRNAGEWDMGILSNAWDPNELIDWGFTENELNFNVHGVDSEEEDENIWRPVENPKTHIGDVYQLGNHRLKCGDSTDPEAVKDLLNGNEPILMVTDPPYGVEYDASWRSIRNKNNRKLKGGKVLNDDRVNWSLAWHLFPGSVAYVWHNGKVCAEVQKSLEEAEFQIISQIIWVKDTLNISRGNYHWRHEPCWYVHKKGHKHNWQGSRKESTVWEINKLNTFEKKEEQTCHSTQKPIECMLKPIRNNSAEWEGVYDPFVGSGTTLIAAEMSGRNAFCMELDPAYCDLVVGRWVRHRKKHNKDSPVILNGETIQWKEENENEL